jgi:hypothetical protein
MAARDARAQEARDAREAIARMENLAAVERGDGRLLAATFDELARRFPELELAAPTLVVNGEEMSLREAADAGFVSVRGDGKIMVQTLKTVSTGAISILAAAVKRTPRKRC